MEVMNHPSREMLSSYSLQALDPEEVRSVKEHLATCPECRRLLKDYDAIADGLLFALPPKAPPPELRSRLAASLAAGRPVTAGSPTRAESGTSAARHATGKPWRGLRFSFFQTALGLAVIALLVATTVLGFQVRYLQQQRAALIKLLEQDQASLALAAQPGVSVIPLKTGPVTGNLVISPDGQTGVLFLLGLSPLDAAHTYQVWLIPASGAPQSAGLLQVPQNQSFVSIQMSSPGPIKNFANIGITIEPRGGSRAPTTKPILLVKL